MQSRVAEHGVEFVIAIWSFPVRHTDVQAEFSCGVESRCAGIDTDDMASHRGELRGKRAISACNVQDPLARAARAAQPEGVPSSATKWALRAWRSGSMFADVAFESGLPLQH